MDTKALERALKYLTKVLPYDESDAKEIKEIHDQAAAELAELKAEIEFLGKVRASQREMIKELTDLDALMSCGHKKRYVVSADEGTSYCMECAYEGEIREREKYFFENQASMAENSRLGAQLHTLQAALDGYKWISVDDKLPELELSISYGFMWESKYVIVCGEYYAPGLACYYADDGKKHFWWWDKRHGEEQKGITHWMPIPKPPNWLASHPEVTK
jgi:hypothetical protein